MAVLKHIPYLGVIDKVEWNMIDDMISIIAEPAFQSPLAVGIEAEDYEIPSSICQMPTSS